MATRRLPRMRMACSASAAVERPAVPEDLRQRGRIGLEDRVRVLRRGAPDLEPPAANARDHAVLAEAQLHRGFQVAGGRGVEQRRQREREGVDAERPPPARQRFATAPAAEREEDRPSSRPRSVSS